MKIVRVLTRSLAVCILTLPLLAGCSSILMPSSLQTKPLTAALYRDATTGDIDICFRDQPASRTFLCSPVAYDDQGQAQITISKPPRP